jgi:transposase
MVRPYCLDLRSRVVRRVEGGHSVRDVAETFGVSVASVVRWSQRQRQTGSAAAKPMGSRLPRSLTGQRDWLLARIAEKPDLTLRELVAELQGRSIKASYGSVWRLLDDEGISFKKKACTPASRTAPTSPAVERAGRPIRAGSTLRAWSSSMRPGPRPT